MKKQYVVFLIFGIFVIMSGCGGGGGGGGRYTLPGEVPIFPITGTSTSTSTSTGTGTGTSTNVDASIVSAWDDYKTESYSSAISKFNEILAQPNLTDAQKAEANNGLGWAQVKASGVLSAEAAFLKAKDYAGVIGNEAKLGLSAVYIQRGQQNLMTDVVTMLEAVLTTDPAFTAQFTHPISVSSAEGHAMLAFAYFWRNDTSKNDKVNAKAQINAVYPSASSNSSIGQIYKTLTDAGLFN